MSRKRYTAEQIIGHLRQAEIRTSEGKTIAEAVRELGISEQTYYRWRCCSLDSPCRPYLGMLGCWSTVLRSEASFSDYR